MKHKVVTVETAHIDTMIADACQAADIKRGDLIAYEILNVFRIHKSTRIVVWF